MARRSGSAPSPANSAEEPESLSAAQPPARHRAAPIHRASGSAAISRDRPPRQRMRFLADDESSSCRRPHHEAHVVVPVRRLRAARRNQCRSRSNTPPSTRRPFRPDLLLRLAQRHAGQVAVAIGVAAQLQPAIQLAMVGQQDPLTVGGDQPGRAGEVARGQCAFAAIRRGPRRSRGTASRSAGVRDIGR